MQIWENLYNGLIDCNTAKVCLKIIIYKERIAYRGYVCEEQSEKYFLDISRRQGNGEYNEKVNYTDFQYNGKSV